METVPFNLLFIIGIVFILINKNKVGLYMIITFFVPALLFTFLFQFRKFDYVFHVFPIFFLISAYALDRIVEANSLVFAKFKVVQRIIGKKNR